MQCRFSRRRLAAWCLAAGLVAAGCPAGPADARAATPELIAGAVGAGGGSERVRNRSDLVILDDRRQADVDRDYAKVFYHAEGMTGWQAIGLPLRRLPTGG